MNRVRTGDRALVVRYSRTLIPIGVNLVQEPAGMSKVLEWCRTEGYNSQGPANVRIGPWEEP
jgi:hypothetical protein